MGRRGYNPKDVDSYISQLTAKLSEIQVRLQHLEAELHEYKTSDGNPEKEIDEEILTGILGSSVARLLTTAKREADFIKKESITKAEEIINSAKHEVKEIHERAEQAFKERIDAAKAEAEKLKAEALSIRQRTLEDLGRKRKEAVAQVERLTAGRDRLINSFEASQKLLTEIKGRVNESLASAKVAADSASRRITSKPAITSAELEEEIAVAKLLDLPQSIYNPGRSSSQKQEAKTMSPDTKNEIVGIPSQAIEDDKIEIGKIEIDELEIVAEARPKKELQIEINPPLIAADRSALEIPTPNLDKAVEHITTSTSKEEQTQNTPVDSATSDSTASLFERLKKEQAQKTKTPRKTKTATTKEVDAIEIKMDTEVEVEVIDTEAEPLQEDLKSEPQISKTPETPDIESSINSAITEETIDKLSRSIEKQIKYGLAQDQNQVLDILRQKKRDHELPPVEDQTAAYIEAINNDELSQLVDQEVSVSKELVLELLINPLRKNLDDCLGNEVDGADNSLLIQKEIRDSYRNFKQIECSKIAHDMAERVLG